MKTKEAKPKQATNAVQSKFVQALKDLNNSLVERNEENALVLTGLLCQQHVLFVGEPGVAKSMIAEAICDWIQGAKKFTVHCCKDTSRNIAFGPVKLSAMKKDVTERNLTGGAADADILVLEEVFKSGPAVLDMFLMLMNERVYKEGLVECKAPLRFLLGVSNEWSPEGCETALAAFFDRFLIRKTVNRIRTRKGIESLLRIPVVGSTPLARSHKPKFKTKLSLEELDQAYDEVTDLRFTDDAKETFFKIHAALLAEGIMPGDRRLKLSVSACQAAAYLQQDLEVRTKHLEVLKHILWVDPTEQADKAGKIISKLTNPIGTEVAALMLSVEDVLAKCTPVDADAKLKDVREKLRRLEKLPQVLEAIEEVEEEIKQNGYRLAGIRM